MFMQLISCSTERQENFNSARLSAIPSQLASWNLLLHLKHLSVLDSILIATLYLHEQVKWTKSSILIGYASRQEKALMLLGIAYVSKERIEGHTLYFTNESCIAWVV